MFPVVVIRQPGQTPIHLQVREAIEVGRECTGVVLVDPKVSRRHLVLAPTHTGGAAEVAVLDLGSMNGTLLAGSRIDTEVVLRAGDEVRLGETTIVLIVDTPGVAPEPPADEAAAAEAPAADVAEVAVLDPAVLPGGPVHAGADATGPDRTPDRTPDQAGPDHTGPDHTGPDRTVDRTPDASMWQRPADGAPGESGDEPADPW